MVLFKVLLLFPIQRSVATELYFSFEIDMRVTAELEKGHWGGQLPEQAFDVCYSA